MTHFRPAFFCLLILFPFIQGFSEGLQIQAGVGLTDALSPNYIQKYWVYGVNFNVGFGASINEKWSFNLAYTQHTFDYSSGTVPAGNNATANQALIRLKRCTKIARLQRLTPFYSVSVGFSLFSAPAVYKKVKNAPLLILPENKLEDAMHSSGPAAEVTLGFDCQLGPQSALFTEWFSSAAFSHRQNFVGWGLRMGVSFTI
jgi:hypothetical protein